ncbi:hypothetical protein O9G_004809 [Rozella allomycis CSF55]|uniref:PH domain-containing protein n=1 Tax=Rozella allomycis (strain CSF55) TaxID=988480 RepID=A0A075B0E3_ROZAC|nr:hypothetical protein O9G_004809 [Rozella allomycis CSF55]|eukprot:EPZ35990.1 hypothetical protein O9G_004809 [Rozella allomycis CSF55]
MEELSTAKKSWVFKKGSFIWSSWKPKWIVLYDSPVLTLHIYDQRSHASPPYQAKHIINPLKLKRCGFVIITGERKFYLAANTIEERDEWLEILKSKCTYLNRPNPPIGSPLESLDYKEEPSDNCQPAIVVHNETLFSKEELDLLQTLQNLSYTNSNTFKFLDLLIREELLSKDLLRRKYESLMQSYALRDDQESCIQNL